MRLGEGTGALLAVPLVRAAAAIMSEMGSLAQTLALLEPPAQQATE
jgi:nicotinate-nucleotide--dimethylbenzimidazole phosphoribosyltransferase